MEIFCIKCKHYDKQHMTYEKCLHPDNRGAKVRRVDHRTEYFMQTGDKSPHELNANNDCKWFEPKEIIKPFRWLKDVSTLVRKPPLFTIIMVVIIWILLNG